MEKRALVKGELVQVRPTHEAYGGQIVLVDEPKDWGCQGVLFLDREYEGLTRYKGQAFVRVKFEDIEPVGQIEWFWVPEGE